MGALSPCSIGAACWPVAMTWSAERFPEPSVNESDLRCCTFACCLVLSCVASSSVVSDRSLTCWLSVCLSDFVAGDATVASVVACGSALARLNVVARCSNDRFSESVPDRESAENVDSASQSIGKPAESKSVAVGGSVRRHD